MRNVHRGIAARPSQRRHCIAGKWLTPGDPCIFAGAAGDDMGAATYAWLRLVDVAVSKVEKILSPSASAKTQAPSMYFLGPESALDAVQRADILSNIFSPFMSGAGRHSLEEFRFLRLIFRPRH